MDTVSCFLRACGGNVATSTQADRTDVTNCAVSCVLSVLMNENCVVVIGEESMVKYTVKE